MTWKAMDNLVEAGIRGFTISVLMTPANVYHLDAFKGMSDHFGSRLQIIRPARGQPKRAATLS